VTGSTLEDAEPSPTAAAATTDARPIFLQIDDQLRGTCRKNALEGVWPRAVAEQPDRGDERIERWWRHAVMATIGTTSGNSNHTDWVTE
jgi:hypothetical protein